MPAMGQGVKAVLFALVLAVKTLLVFIFRIFNRVDFRSPEVRRAAYIAAGVIFLGGLFASIHLLNVNREVAMKQPRKVVRPAPTPAAKPVASSVPAQNAAPAARAETAAVTPARETLIAPAGPAAETAVQKGHVIQIATFAAQADADKLVLKVQQEGMKAFVKPLVRTGGKTYYCVFIGAFASNAEAEQQLAKFKKKELARPFQDAFIRTL
jgi:cell division septation protein DedD